MLFNSRDRTDDFCLSVNAVPELILTKILTTYWESVAVHYLLLHHSIVTNKNKKKTASREKKKTPQTTETLTNVNGPLTETRVVAPPPPLQTHPLLLHLPCDIHPRRRRRIRLQTHRLSREYIRLLRMSYRLTVSAKWWMPGGDRGE